MKANFCWWTKQQVDKMAYKKAYKHLKTGINEAKYRPLSSAQSFILAVGVDDGRREKNVTAAFFKLGDATKIGLSKPTLTRSLKIQLLPIKVPFPPTQLCCWVITWALAILHEGWGDMKPPFRWLLNEGTVRGGGKVAGQVDSFPKVRSSQDTVVLQSFPA